MATNPTFEKKWQERLQQASQLQFPDDNSPAMFFWRLEASVSNDSPHVQDMLDRFINAGFLFTRRHAGEPWTGYMTQDGMACMMQAIKAVRETNPNSELARLLNKHDVKFTYSGFRSA